MAHRLKSFEYSESLIFNSKTIVDTCVYDVVAAYFVLCTHVLFLHVSKMTQISSSLRNEGKCSHFPMETGVVT